MGKKKSRGKRGRQACVGVHTTVNAGKVCWWVKVLMLSPPAANFGWRNKDGDEKGSALGPRQRISPSLSCHQTYITLYQKEIM